MLGLTALKPPFRLPLRLPLRGLGAWWDWDTKWYAFQAWRQGVGGWKVVHQEGPVKMTRSQAQSRQVDLMEENWGATVYGFEWNGSRYVRVF